MATPRRRPHLTREDRFALIRMASRAEAHLDSPQRAYAQGVVDTLRWLADNTNPTPLFEEVTR